jgi:HPt (histidine-containing phosphotransfer) domain-containing protein
MKSSGDSGGPEAHTHSPENGGGVVIEVEAIRALEDLGGGGTTFIAEIVELFLTDAVMRVHEMQAALDGPERERILQAAHALKSSSAQVGAIEFSRCCAELEGLCRTIDGIDDLVPTGRRAVAMYGEVQVALQALLGEN